jgi:protein-tyrosine phosphatase
MTGMGATFIRPFYEHGPQADVEADRLMTRLWQGSNPLKGAVLARARFDVLVLAAQEHQYPASDYPGLVRVIGVPLDDRAAPLTYAEAKAARDAAGMAASLWRRGARVLVCCHMGINRSGLISALIIRQVTGCSGKRAVEIVQEGRLSALSNVTFVKHLSALGEKRR